MIRPTDRVWALIALLILAIIFIVSYIASRNRPKIDLPPVDRGEILRTAR